MEPENAGLRIFNNPQFAFVYASFTPEAIRYKSTNPDIVTVGCFHALSDSPER
ncbi:MAG TPA: hypothetical protein VGL22_06060 [Terracidiphilus sp.]|jgi:hypothetical protein